MLLQNILDADRDVCLAYSLVLYREWMRMGEWDDCTLLLDGTYG